MKKFMAIFMASLFLLLSFPVALAEGEVAPCAECRHSDYEPHDVDYRYYRIGCKLHYRMYRVCNNCGADVTYTTISTTTDHLGPLTERFIGYDSNGNMIWKRECDACGQYV